MGWQDAPIVGQEKSGSWKDAPIVSDVPQPGNMASFQTDSVPAYSPDASASAGDTAIASLASDPNQRIAYYSQQRGIPPDRYRVVSGRVAYQDDAGQWQYEESPHFFPRSFREAGQQIASGVGEGIPAVAGGTVGVASAPLLLAGPGGLATSMAATGGAAAAGEAIRQALADRFVSPAAPDRMKILLEGGQAALGQGIGAGIESFATRWANPDVLKYNPQAAAALEAKAQQEGIQLTPAESTNLASLKAQQKFLGNMPQSADDMAAFYEKRSKDQIEPAVNRFMDSVSPQGSATVTGLNAREASASAIEAAKKARTAAVSPAYKAVVRPDNVVDPKKLGSLLDDEFFANQIQSVKSDPLYKMGDLEDTSLPVLDAVKKNLDAMKTAAVKAGDRNRARLIGDRIKDMLAVVDKAAPDYPAARAMFEAKSPEVDEIAGSVLKALSGLKDTSAHKAAGVLFGQGSSPEQIAIAKREIEKKSPGVVQDLKRAWLQTEWAASNKSTLAGEPVNAGAKWRLRLLGNPEQAARTKAALDPKEFDALSNLSDVLEAVGRVKPIGSDTAWNQEMQRLEKERASPMLAKVFGNAISPQKWGELVKDWATEKALKNHASEITRIIQQPNARALLQEIKVTSPKTARWYALTGHLLTQFSASSIGRTGPTKEGQ